MKREYREHDNDPFYVSTDNWKTLKQWLKLGYEIKYPLWNDLEEYSRRTIFGYNNATCAYKCARHHRSMFFRRAKKCRRS